MDPAWLQRVSDVVDMITSQGFYTIVNVHHDSWTWADVSAPGANLTMIEEKFYRLWYQIGTKLACKGSQVAFEPINEPPVSSNFVANCNFSFGKHKLGGWDDVLCIRGIHLPAASIACHCPP